MPLSKKQIAKQWKRLTFSEMKGIRERSRKELEQVLKFEKGIRKRAKKK